MQSCATDQACVESTQSDLNISLFSMKNVTIDSSTFIKTADSVFKVVKVVTPGYPDTIYNKASVKSISLPLSQVSDTTVFIARFGEITNDTIYAIYKRNLVFLGYECGFRTDFTIDTFYSANHRFDSLEIYNRFVNDKNEVNIKAYFRYPNDTLAIKQ